MRTSAVAVALFAVLLAGCQVRVDAGVDLRPDDTAAVDLSVGVRIDESVTEGFGGAAPTEDPADLVADAEQDLGDLADACGFDEDLASVEEYAEDDFDGATITLDGVPLDAVNCFFSEDAETEFFQTFDISRDGDEYVFEATLADLASQLQSGLGGQKRQVAVEGDGAPPDLEDLQELEEELEGLGDVLEGQGFGDPSEIFDITFRLTFPGEVGEHNATRVEGTTAIWELDGTAAELMAVGDAGSGGGLGDVLPWILVALAIVVGLGLIIVLVVRSRRGGGTARGGTTYPAGPGPPGAGHAPPPGAPGSPGAVPGYGPPPGTPGGAGPGYGPPPGGQPQAYGGQPQAHGAPPQQGGHGGYGPPPGAPAGQQPGTAGGPPPGLQGPPPGGPGGPAPGSYGGPPPSTPGGPPAAPGEGAPPPTPPADAAPPPVPDAPAAEDEGSGDDTFDPGATRTFRPQDLLPPDEDPRQ